MMKMKQFIFILFLIAGCKSSLAAVPHTRMLPGSFLQYQANSVAQLVHEVDTDNLVASRYMTHFHIQSRGMLELALASLFRTRLSQKHSMAVWYCHNVPHGKEMQGFHWKIMPVGSWVFETPEGVPALIAVCGNPIGRVNLPAPRTAMSVLFQAQYQFQQAPSTPEAAYFQQDGGAGQQIAMASPQSPGLLPMLPPLFAGRIGSLGGPPYWLLGLPFFVHGGGSSPPPPLRGLPPQSSSAGGQSPFGAPVPESGPPIFLTALGCSYLVMRRRHRIQS